MPAAVDLPVLVEVDEVHHELFARAADKAGGMPTHAVTCPRCKHGDIATVYLASALEGEKEGRNVDFDKAVQTVHDLDLDIPPRPMTELVLLALVYHHMLSNFTAFLL